MEGNQPLKLTIERGPREGETLEFQPGRVVKIGRVVKGNNLAIKDAGISSHHLSIAFVSGEWILSDLDSSNGTSVNGDLIGADEPVKLSDGDTIKIGEVSSIKVSIGLQNDYPAPRRNPSRRTVKNVEQNSVGIMETRSRRRGKLVPIVDVKKPELGLGFGDEDEVSRSKAVSETVQGQESLSMVGEVATLKNIGPNKTNQRKTTQQNQKKANASLLPPLNSTVDVPSALKEEASALIVEKKTRRGRHAKKKLEEGPALTYSEAFALNSSFKDSDLRKVDDEIDGNEPKLQEVTDGFEEEETPAHIVEKKTRRGRPAKTKQEETNKVQCKNNSLGASEKRKKDDEIHGNGNEPMPEENADGSEKEVEKDEEPDLEKMTLGEWFDYLQVSLTKEINDTAEQLISDMRKKARMSKELLMQKKNEKNA